ARINGSLFDSVNNSAGTTGMILQTTGSGTQWVATSTLGITASISGGTTDYLARWTSATTLGKGITIDNGSVAGINATSSTVSFNVQGTGTNDIFNAASSSGTSYLRVTQAGNIGIGTTSPIGQLAINQSLALTSTTTGTNVMSLVNAATINAGTLSTTTV